MHLAILVEDMSGQRFLDKVLPAILGDSDTYKVIAYKGTRTAAERHEGRKGSGKADSAPQLASVA